MDNEILFPNILAELARNGINQTQYGEYIGLSQSSVSDRLIGNVEFDLYEIKKTCELLNKPFDYLFS